MADTISFDIKEKLDILLKASFGVPSTSDKKEWADEFVEKFNKGVNGEDLFLDEIPGAPDFEGPDATVRTAAEAGLIDVDFAWSNIDETATTYSIDASNKSLCSIVDDATGTVRRFRFLILERCAGIGTDDFSWLKKNTDGNILFDSLQFNFKMYEDVAGNVIKPYEYKVFTEDSIKAANQTIPSGSAGGNWIYDINSGILLFPDVGNLQSGEDMFKIGDTNKPVMTVYKYIGRKGISKQITVKDTLPEVTASEKNQIVVQTSDNTIHRYNGSAWVGIGGGSVSGVSYDANGNVGIGTDWPTYKLDVNGDIKVRDIDFYHSPKWTENTSTDVAKNWTRITSSSDGTKLAAVVWGENIWTSVDSGEKWDENKTTGDGKNWYDITSSSDGTKLAAIVNGGKIWTSIDAGASWADRGDTNNWKTITSSSDGTKLAAVVDGGNIWISDDAGESWTPRGQNRNWYGITSSSDGTKLAACVYGGNIWTSVDAGETWTDRGYTKRWQAITSSSDGTKLAAVVSNGQIWTSVDSGATWTPRGDVAKNWLGITSSSDGTKLAVCVYDGNIWTSVDSGETWAENTSIGAAKNWYDITSSSDGTTLAATVYDGNIWTFNTEQAVSIYTSGLDYGNTKLNFKVSKNNSVTGNMILDSSGNVGIGTDWPTYKLDVNGDIKVRDIDFYHSPKWTENTSTVTKYWYYITSSSDGTKLAAIVKGGNIWTSIDSGLSWIENIISTTARSWYGITSSSDGTKLAAVVQNGNIWTSVNSGQTWTDRGETKYWRDITSSSDGTKLAATVNGGNIWTSVDSGVTWTERGVVKNWFRITSSSDGTKLAAIVQNGNIWTSVDSGRSWAENTSTGGTKGWQGITSSSDGTKLAAVVWGENIWTSVDSGLSWTENTSTVTKLWRTITSSSDGTKLAAIVKDGNIWTSVDSGLTWTENIISTTYKSWRGITSSSDGTKLAACVDSGNIWTFNTEKAGSIYTSGLDDGNSKLNFAVFKNNSVTATMILDSIGNVGIGATLPSEKLEVNGGNILLKGSTPRIKFLSNNEQHGFQILSNHNDTFNYGLSIRNTSDTELINIDKDGNVRSGDLNTIMNGLIGSELNSKLHIQGGGISIYQNNTWNDTNKAQEALIYLDVNNGGTVKSGIQWKPLYQHSGPTYTKDSAGIYFQPESGGAFQGGLSFWTNNSPYQTVAGKERMRIDKNGNVGIGTTSPGSGYKLEVIGNIKADALHLTTYAGLRTGTGVGSIILGHLTDGAAGGEYSVSAGQKNTSSGDWSVAMGYNNTSTNSYSVAMGESNTSAGYWSVAMGFNNTNGGNFSVAMGHSNKSPGIASVAMGLKNNSGGSSGNYSVAMGQDNTSTGDWSVAMGLSNTSGYSSVAMGQNNTSTTLYSVAMGYGNTSTGQSSVAMGFINTSGGQSSVAMGESNASTGGYSVAMGKSNTSGNYYSVAMGDQNTSGGYYSVAMGRFNHAEKNYSMALGHRAWAGDNIRFAIGISDTPSTALAQSGSNNNKFVIDKDGNVGIGTSSPGCKLTISGNGAAGGTGRIGFVDTDSAGRNWFVGPFRSSDAAFHITPSSGNLGSAGDITKTFCINYNGNVGIGTTSPGFKLEVAGTLHITGTMTLMVGGTGHTSHFGYSTNKDVYLRSGLSAGKVVIQDTGGNVGIGTSSPLYKLDVAGTIRATGTITGNISGSSNYSSYTGYVNTTDERYNHQPVHLGLRCKFSRYTLGGFNTYGGSYTDMITIGSYYDSSGGNKSALGIPKSGNLGMRVYRATSWDGAINQYATVDVGATVSDLRIKKNIEIVQDNIALELFRKIHSYRYDYINTDDDDDEHIGTSFGYLAQNVREHYEVATRLSYDVIPNEHRIIENPQWTEIHDNSNNKLFKLTIPDLKEPSGNTVYNFKLFYDVSMNTEEDLKGLPIRLFDVKSLENEPTSFIFDKIKTLPKKVYIHGKYVDDFHRIFKKKLHSLHYAASKDIDRIQQQEKAKLATAETKLATAEIKINTLESENTTLKSRLDAIETRLTSAGIN